jgi:pimeloyl-ACP methyl ester carboxylesterase
MTAGGKVRPRRGVIGLVTAAMVALGFALAVPSAATPRFQPPGRPTVPPSARDCGGKSEIRFEWLPGFNDPATPSSRNRVGVLEVGPASAKNVLVLNPGTSAGAAYFRPLADDIVRDSHGAWQVWSVERRENQLEDQSVADQAKQGTATTQQLFDYYLGWLSNPSVTTHFQLIPDSTVSFAKGWGLNVEIEDLHRVVERAAAHGRRVVLGGHSLGGSITTAYATWDFDGKPGANDLAGLVYIDGGSNPTPVSSAEATQSLQDLQKGSPWLTFGGIPAPFAGLFGSGGGLLTVIDPNSPSIGQTFPLLPAALKPPVRVNNAAQFGYALDTKTSPSSLIAAQAHLGQLADSGTPRGWERAGAITPIQRYATMFSGAGLQGVDGVAWYHPLRLTIDAGAVADGNPNPAQSILDVKAIHGHDLDKHLRIYAFGAALGGQRVLDAAQTLAAQSAIPTSNLTLINRQSTYAHNDPAGATPQNDFVDNLIPFLDKLAKPGLGPCNAPGKPAAHRPERTHGGMIREAHGHRI